jgi:hypothetical protein
MKVLALVCSAERKKSLCARVILPRACVLYVCVPRCLCFHLMRDASKECLLGVSRIKPIEFVREGAGHLDHFQQVVSKLGSRYGEDRRQQQGWCRR